MFVLCYHTVEILPPEYPTSTFTLFLLTVTADVTFRHVMLRFVMLCSTMSLHYETLHPTTQTFSCQVFNLWPSVTALPPIVIDVENAKAPNNVKKGIYFSRQEVKR